MGKRGIINDGSYFSAYIVALHRKNDHDRLCSDFSVVDFYQLWFVFSASVLRPGRCPEIPDILKFVLKCPEIGVRS